MTNEHETGTNKLAQRILSDAERDAAVSLQEAAAAVDWIRAESEEAVAKKRAEFAKARETAVNDVLDGCRTRASIEGRKLTLARKRAKMDSVFDCAYQALLQQGEETRGAVCARMLRAEAEGGETVRPAAADRAAIEAFVAENAALKLKVCSQNAPFEAGFLLIGEGYEKDCSFASLMQELRGSEETAVAKLLFD